MKMKRVLAMVLVASMVFGATGCMKKDAGKEVKKDRKAVAVPEDIWEPYEEEVTISTIQYENVAIHWDEGDDYDDNPWYREYKERFNINVENEWVSSDNATKINLAIAEGDTPDVFSVNAQQLEELKEADMIWDMTEIWEDNASDLLKSYVEKAQATFETGKIDGKLYGIPQLSQGAEEYMSCVWVKKDWMKEAGITEIKTIEDFEKLAKTIQSKHGKFGITETSDLDGMKGMAPAWGAYPGIWIEKEDGSIEYGSVQPEMKQVLETYARWYEEGMVDPEFTITDAEKMFQKLLAGETGVSPFTNYFVWGVGPGSIEQWGIDGSYDAFPIPTATGEEVKATTEFANYGYTVVSKDCPNPEAAIRLMNFYVALVNGEAGVDAEMEKKLFNLGTVPGPFRMFDTEAEYKRYLKIQEALPEGSKADTSDWGQTAELYSKCMRVVEENDAAGGGEYLLYAAEHCFNEVGAIARDKDLILEDKLWGTPPETLAKSGSTLDDILIEGFTKIIVGEKPVDYFDTLVQDWAKAGGEKATKEVNEVYGK